VWGNWFSCHDRFFPSPFYFISHPSIGFCILVSLLKAWLKKHKATWFPSAHVKPSISKGSISSTKSCTPQQSTYCTPICASSHLHFAIHESALFCFRTETVQRSGCPLSPSEALCRAAYETKRNIRLTFYGLSDDSVSSYTRILG
jgi:hypothetical protein